MKITGSGKIDTTPVRRKNVSRAGDGAGFSLDQTDDATGAKPVSGAGPVSVVGSLLSIQEVDDQGEGRSQDPEPG